MSLDFQAELDAIKKDLDSLTNSTTTNATSWDKIREKKALWVRIQKLKINYEPESEDIKSTLQALEQQLSLRGPKTGLTLGSIIRGIGVLLGFILTFPFLIAVAHVRVLKTLLKITFGIPPSTVIFSVLHLFSQYILALMCVEVNHEGIENLYKASSSTNNQDQTDSKTKSQSVLAFFQHLSNLDAFTITATSPVGFKWIGKESLFRVPLFGQVALSFGTMIGLDRSNLEGSIEQLNKTGQMIKKQGASIAIAPEGTRSVNGHLGEFKKGPFHLATACKVPIVPIMLWGQYDLWPPGQPLPSSGQVSLKFLPAVTSYQDLDYKSLLKKIRLLMLDASLEDPIKKPSTFVSVPFWIRHAIVLIGTYFLFYKYVLILYNPTTIVYLFAYLMGCYVVSFGG